MGEVELSKLKEKVEVLTRCERNNSAGSGLAFLGLTAAIGVGVGVVAYFRSANNTQRSHTYSQTRSSARNTDPSYPQNWSISKFKRDDDHFCLINCRKDSNEFKFVESLIRKSMPLVTVKEVVRIENKKLYESYYKKKIQMERLNGNASEKNLFYGTDIENINSICRQGFDLRLSGEITGSKHGKGIYFAKDAKFYDNYNIETFGIKWMFLANVLVGNYTIGDPCYIRPPPLDSTTNQLYDSCVNNIIDPTAFVIFDSSQVYPEYLITY